jgi:hypothetical protein
MCFSFYCYINMNANGRNDKKIEALEMWLSRRILRVSWIEHVTNAEILRPLREC